MKIRTDFVTNSSSNSFLVFHIRNRELYDFLQKIGVRIEKTAEGELSDKLVAVLPSGRYGYIETNDCNMTYPNVTDFHSISTWLICLLLECGYDITEDCNKFQQELCELLIAAGAVKVTRETLEDLLERGDYTALTEALSGLDSMDDHISEASIAHGEGFEGDVSGERIRASNGTRTVLKYISGFGEEQDVAEDLWFGLYGGWYAGDKFFDVVEAKGLSTPTVEIWKDGQWREDVTRNKDTERNKYGV